MPSPDFLHITYRPDLHILLARWMRPVTGTEMQQGYYYLLEQAAAHTCRQWLLDVRRRINTDKDGARWMVETFLPQAVQQLGGRFRLAYLLPPVSLRDQDADNAFPPPEFFADKPFVGSRFIDEGEAIAWLQ